MFVVLVTHNTGHGEVTDVIQLTRSAKKAVKIVRSVEKLGFEFFSIEVGAWIVQLKPEGQPCCKNEFKWNLGDGPPSMLILWRHHSKEHRGKNHTENCWEEEWFNENLKRVVDGKKK